MKKLAAILAMSLLTGAAWAESRITAVPSTTTSLSATARLNFAVNVPRVLYLRVGDAGATINTVNFNVGLSGSLPEVRVMTGLVTGSPVAACTPLSSLSWPLSARSVASLERG